MRDSDNMAYDRFEALLRGIGPETPLGRIVAIRSETNEHMLENFTPAQRKIREEWQKKQEDMKPQWLKDQEQAELVAYYQELFRNMFS